MPQPKYNLALYDAISRIKSICSKSQGRSQYFPYGGSGYKASVTHYFESSTEVAGGAVQPGSEEDLAEIVKAIVDTKVDFAVTCGGHSSNPGFSSTKGIQIYLARLNQIDVDVDTKLVRVGAGCLFEELYQEVNNHKLNIVGGSGLSGVGVSGWMLGGGYSAKTSLRGLGVDNLEAVRLVLPDGTITAASEKENPDLFFALKGGVNNFGIVTEFTLRAHDQPEGSYYAETFTYENKEDFQKVKEAMYKIIQKQDSKANIEAKFNHFGVPGTNTLQVTLTVHCVYDGPYPSEDPFTELKAIPHVYDESDGHLHQQTSSFILADLRRSYHNGTYDLLSDISLHPELAVASESATPEEELPKPPMAGIGEYPRGRWGNVMVDQFTPGIIDEVEKQSFEVAKGVAEHGGTRIIIGIWPFTTAMFDHTTESAFPHKKGKPDCPILVFFTWEDKKNDKYWIDAIKATLDKLREKVYKERPESESLPFFINTALAEATTVEDLYRENLPRLRELRKKYDPHGLMDRTGGFRIPPAEN